MKNSLQNLIREAFNTAYKTHKKSKLNEGAEAFTNGLSPEQIAIADEKLNTLVNKGPGYENITWSPDGTGGLNQAQQNYMIEKLFELYKSTRDKKYKNAVAQMYPYGSTYKNGKFDKSPLFKLANQRFGSTTALQRLREKNPEVLENFLGDIWLRVFGGHKLSKGNNSGQDMFDTIINTYKGTAEDKQKRPTGFGAYLATWLINQVPNEIQNATTKGSEFSAGVTSLDAPIDATGKTREVGDKESPEEKRERERAEKEDKENKDREREDIEGSIEDSGDEEGSDSESELDATELAGMGTDTEISDEPTDEPDNEVGGGYEEKHATEKTKRALETVHLFINLVNQSISAAKAEGVYNKQPLFFDMLGWMVNDSMDYEEMLATHPERFTYTNKEGKPTTLAPATYFSSVIKKDLGKAASFIDTYLDLKWPVSKGIAPDFFCGGRANCSEFQASNFFKAAKAAKQIGMLEEQKFLSENLDKIMDRVYRRLSKNLNG
jgi:hypothetical protein